MFEACIHCDFIKDERKPKHLLLFSEAPEPIKATTIIPSNNPKTIYSMGGIYLLVP